MAIDPSDLDENPAFSGQAKITPALLQAVEDDPSLLGKISKKMLLMQMRQQHMALTPRTAPTAHRQAFIETLAKLADAIPKQNAGAAGAGGPAFTLSINLGNGKTMEVKATPAAENLPPSTVSRTPIDAEDAKLVIALPDGGKSEVNSKEPSQEESAEPQADLPQTITLPEIDYVSAEETSDPAVDEALIDEVVAAVIKK